MKLTTAFMNSIRSVVMWIVWNIPCGRLAPRLMGFALNSEPVRKGSNASSNN